MSLTKLIHDNEQDREEVRAWVRSLTGEQALDFWSFLQREWDDPRMEAMSRLAALKFAEFAEEELT